MAHHAEVKWQTNSHGLCLSKFQDGDIVIETDFTEKSSHVPGAVLTCAQHPQTTLMVAVVHFSPQLWEGGRKVHQTETWNSGSEDPAHDLHFYRHALSQIADYVLDEPRSDATAAAREAHRTPRMHMFTDGCAKQCKGRCNFRFLADSVRQIGFIVEHHFGATSRFKGCYHEIDVMAKNAMKKPEQRGDLISGAAGVVKLLKGYVANIGERNKELADYFATWSPYRIRRVLGAIYRPQQQLKGITGTGDTYLFVGANAGLTDRETTRRRGRHGSVPDVIEDDWALPMGTDEGEVEVTELTMKRARAYVPWTPTWTRDGAAGEGSRE